MLCPAAAWGGVLISEFMAINQTTLADEDGSSPDWIELYNSGTNAVDLGGWYLSNQAATLAQWRLPSTNLGPNAFLVVFASGKDRAVPGAPLHTNFKLKNSGGYLALVMPDGVTKASEIVSYPPQFADISYGCVMTQLGAGDWAITQPPVYLYPPTPGTWNNSVGSARAPMPVTFWPPAGVYASNTLWAALAAFDSDSIHYTLDGSTPGTNSPVCTNAIRFSTDAVIRARAYRDGLPSEVSAANYILISPSLTNFSSNLPLVVVDTLGQTIQDVSKIGAYAIFIETNGPAGRATLLSPGDYVGRLGIGLHGNSSLGFPKLPYKIELDGENGQQVNQQLLGQPPGNNWVLYPPYSDKTFLNNFLSFEWFEQMGHYSVRRRYVELFLRSAPGRLTYGDYLGIYVLLEKIRVSPSRVNIAKLTPSDNTPPAVTGGYIFDKNRIKPGKVTFTTSSGQELIVYRPKTPTQPQHEYLADYVNAFEAVLYGPNWRDPLCGYASYIESDSFVDFHWITEFTKDIDAIRLKNFMSKDRNGKIQAGPIWDWDLSLGNANYAEGGKTNGWYYPLLSDSDNLWLRQLRTDPDFHQKIINRWGTLRLGVLNVTNIFARIDQLTNYLWEAQARDFIRWPRLGIYVWPNPNGAAGGWDVDYASPATYAGIIGQMGKWLLGRYLWIDGQFVPAPALATNGALLSMSAPLGSVYYTLDATDPRADGGALSPSARLYSGTVTLTNNAGIFARAFCTNAWSLPPGPSIWRRCPRCASPKSCIIPPRHRPTAPLRLQTLSSSRSKTPGPILSTWPGRA